MNNNNEENTKPKYAVNSRGMATSLKFIGGFDFQVYEDLNNEGRDIFMFEDTSEFRIILGILSNLSKVYKNK